MNEEETCFKNFVPSSFTSHRHCPSIPNFGLQTCINANFKPVISCSALHKIGSQHTSMIGNGDNVHFQVEDSFVAFMLSVDRSLLRSGQ